LREAERLLRKGEGIYELWCDICKATMGYRKQAIPEHLAEDEEFYYYCIKCAKSLEGKEENAGT
jgi:hypothetical protein